MLISLMIHSVFASQDSRKNLKIMKIQPLHPSKTCCKLKNDIIFLIYFMAKTLPNRGNSCIFMKKHHNSMVHFRNP